MSNTSPEPSSTGRIEKLESCFHLLEAQVQQLRAEAIQKRGFMAIVCTHLAIASIMSLFNRWIPLTIASGWMLGAYAFACTWFAASPRPIGSRLVRAFVGVVAIYGGLNQVHHWIAEEVPDAFYLAAILSPALILSAQFVLKYFRVGLHALDLSDEPRRSLTLLDFFILTAFASTMMALLPAIDSSEVSDEFPSDSTSSRVLYLGIITYGVGLVIAFAVVFVIIAKTNSNSGRFAIVAVGIVWLTLYNQVAVLLLGSFDLIQFSWTTTRDLPWTALSADHTSHNLTCTTFELVQYTLASIGAPLMTAIFLHRQGYRIVVPAKRTKSF